ncbi:MAG TPA: type II toxin-antitoxin system VapC family toxin [Planctomycetota bacterium]|nr:type II toxin-antitoxin system VapC family toxin [Planctomycetota bacterium]
MTFVLDAALALAFCFRDEATPFTESVLDSLQKTRAVVPAIWIYEVANGLVMGERRKRVKGREVRELLAFLQALPVDVQPLPGALDAAAGALQSIASEHGITAYDAAYLELAARLDLPLATLDGEDRRSALKQAAASAGVRLHASG